MEQERMRHLDCEYFKLEQPMSNLPFYRPFGVCILPSAQKCKLDGEAFARPGWCPVLDNLPPLYMPKEGEQNDS